MEQSLVKIENNTAPSFSDSQSFEHAQRVAKMLSSSNLIPKDYQGNIQNTMIALEMANRIGASPLQVMQNLYIVHGKPSWSSSFIIAAINSSGKFSPLRFEMTEKGTDKATCTAWAFDLQNNEKLEGPTVSMQMAKEEGWLTKTGSKWKTMPDLMLRYRAAAFFGRLYAPEILMGMHTAEEVNDFTQPAQLKTMSEEEIVAERMERLIKKCNTPEEVAELRESIEDENQLSLFDLKVKEVQNV